MYPNTQKKVCSKMMCTLMDHADGWTDYPDFRYARVAQIILDYFLEGGNIKALPACLEKKFLMQVVLLEINSVNPSPEERNALLAMFLQKYLLKRILYTYYLGWRFRSERAQPTASTIPEAKPAPQGTRKKKAR